MPLTPEIEAMWTVLYREAMADKQLSIAEQCSAALGDVSRTRYLRRLNKMVMSQGPDAYEVQASLCILSKDFKRAEAIYLEHNDVEAAMGMYEELHRYEDSIAVAEAKGHANAAQLRDTYFEWLLNTKQEEKAGALREAEGKYLNAIQLYLQGGLPARAAAVVKKYGVRITSPELIESIAAALAKAGMFERAGEFLERVDQSERALEAYRKGRAFRRAVELARHAFPSKVTELEEEWGDFLVAQRQVDAAVNHFIEANAARKALSASVASRQWSKAVSIAESQSIDITKPFLLAIARHFEDSMSFKEAEKYYVKVGSPETAVEMYARLGMMDQAQRVASAHMSDRQASALYLSQGQKLEAQGKLRDAESMYIRVGNVDLAIVMYKKAGMVEDMLRLVAAHRSELLGETRVRLAQEAETAGQVRRHIRRAARNTGLLLLAFFAIFRMHCVRQGRQFLWHQMG
jgi:intraflagellar transport protein 172